MNKTINLQDVFLNHSAEKRQDNGNYYPHQRLPVQRNGKGGSTAM